MTSRKFYVATPILIVDAPMILDSWLLNLVRSSGPMMRMQMLFQAAYQCSFRVLCVVFWGMYALREPI